MWLSKGDLLIVPPAAVRWLENAWRCLPAIMYCGMPSACCAARRAAFTNAQTGWNSVTFSSPVTISAGSRYVAAVWTQDHYVTVIGQFATSGVPTGDSTAPQDSGSVHNGKFQPAYVAPTYPESSFNSNGYLADVLFVGKDFEVWGIPM